MARFKTLSFFLLIGTLAFSGCNTAHKLAVNQMHYNQDVEVKIERMVEQSGQSTWGGTATRIQAYVPPVGHNFKTLTIRLINHSSEDQEIDFAKFYLVKPDKKIIYPPTRIYVNSKVFVIGAREHLTLKANDEVTRRMMFAFPKKERPEYIQIDETIYPINYQ